jgi:hypothetical protein
VSDVFDRIFAPQSFQAREQRVFGLVTANVDKIEDGGMYRLKFHGMNGQDTDEPSAPARVMMPTASGRYGMHFLPERGDEVLVGFYAGDTNMPIILGAVYNKDKQPPLQAKQSPSNNVRTIVSRSGHELTFDDTPGSEKLTIRTQGGHSIVLDDAPAGPNITMTSTGGRTIVVDDTPPGKISLHTPTCSITMAEPGAINIQAMGSINLSAPNITIAAALALELTGGAGSSVVDGIPFKLHTHAVPPFVTPPTLTSPPVPV